jgi:zinc D-Ala-D-Ala carboxypeptidase
MYLKYFKLSDFDCQETGENSMSEELLLKLDKLREACGFPFIITSGYRSPSHSIEAAKTSPGTHTKGIAVDIRVRGGAERYLITKHAMAMGFTGIGIAKSFVHVDIRTTAPVVWSY